LDTITGISNITYTTDTSTSAFSTVPLRVNAFEGIDYRLQPTMSLPKTTGELKIPNNPDVVKPEDSMKEKKKAQEDAKKKLRKNSKRKSTQEKRVDRKRGNSHQKGVLHNLS